MNEVEFRADLAEIRLRAERLLSQGLSVGQLIALGAELEAQIRAIQERPSVMFGVHGVEWPKWK